MENSQFFLVTAHDGNRWCDDEVVQGNPIPRVRQLLGGRWERSKQFDEFIKAFFSAGEKRVLVMGFKPGTTEEQVKVIMDQIRSGREDRN